MAGWVGRMSATADGGCTGTDAPLSLKNAGAFLFELQRNEDEQSPFLLVEF
jgi:hypothetical protein